MVLPHLQKYSYIIIISRGGTGNKEMGESAEINNEKRGCKVIAMSFSSYMESSRVHIFWSIYLEGYKITKNNEDIISFKLKNLD